ncbi:hypothetical protein WSS15_07650 [Acetobacter pasteurianus]|nr:hypothetical protein WSS15_07650 [Acetobacter pasteurianus]
MLKVTNRRSLLNFATIKRSKYHAKINIHLFTLRMLAAQGIDAAVEFT